MTDYRITARARDNGLVVLLGVEKAGSGMLALNRAKVRWPKYANGVLWELRAEPMLLRWPEPGKVAWEEGAA